jgi:hypothetical protein
VKIKPSQYTLLFTAFLILCVTVQGQQPAARLTVNGHEVKGKVLEIDGKHFVSVEDLAQSLGGAIAYNSDQIALTIPQAQSAKASPIGKPASAIQTGRMKGTLTHFISIEAGSKPESGDQIWLIPGHAEIPETWHFDADLDTVTTYEHNVGDKIIGAGTITSVPPPTKYHAIKHTIADGNGNFEIPDIPVGGYTLIIQSTRVDRFGLMHVDMRDRDGWLVVLGFTVHAGETVDASWVFRR